MFATNAFAQVPFAAANGLFYPSDVVDTVSVSDSVFAVANFSVLVAESAEAADQASSSFSIFSSVSDTITVTDLASASYSINAAVSDSAALTDATLVNVNFVVAFNDAAALTDTTSSLPNYLVQIFETVLALDALSSRELWEQIDDTQIPGWTDILIPVTLEDIAVFGGGNFGTLAFAGNLNEAFNPNPAVWNEVDDTQTITWTDIVAV